MHIANILPANAVNPEMIRQDCEMYLTHVVLEHPEKFSFLAKDEERKVDSYKILDNSACELGESLDFSKVLEAAEIIGADELVLPDKLMRGDSLTKTLKYLVELPEEVLHKYSLMAVAQGETYEEVLSCAMQISLLPQVRTIGIPKWYCHYQSSNGLGRHNLTRDLIQLWGGRKMKDIHWLGVGIGLRELVGPIGGFVRSCDTGYFTMLATDKYKGQSVATERIKEMQIDLFHMDVNMSTLKLFIQQQEEVVA